MLIVEEKAASLRSEEGVLAAIGVADDQKFTQSGIGAFDKSRNAPVSTGEFCAVRI